MDGASFSDHRRRLEAIARAVKADQALSAEMAEWEVATIADGLDHID